MLSRKSVARWIFAVAAAVQVLLPASASLADGWLDRADARSGLQVSHIESHGSSTCARIHPDNCALCRVASAVATPSKAIVLPERVARVAVPAAVRAILGGSSIDHGLPNSRAPPAADPLVGHTA